jgi:hypothetical protein
MYIVSTSCSSSLHDVSFHEVQSLALNCAWIQSKGGATTVQCYESFN